MKTEDFKDTRRICEILPKNKKEGKRMYKERDYYAERTVPWSGFGTDIRGAKTVREALKTAGLDWGVRQSPVYDDNGLKIEGFSVNIREDTGMPLGIVSDRYGLVGNDEAFSFADGLSDEGVSFMYAGVFRGGRSVWLLGKLPERYDIEGDRVNPYILFMNSHDGSSGVKAAMTPVRVVCSNMLNLALRRAGRTWTSRHTGNIRERLTDARETLFAAESYMRELKSEAEDLALKRIEDMTFERMLSELLPIQETDSGRKAENIERMRAGIREIYMNAPDLKDREKSGLRFINAVSDYAGHGRPARMTPNREENLFIRASEGFSLTDRAYTLIKAA